MNEEEGAHLVGDMDELVAPQESTRVHGGQGKTYYCCGDLYRMVLNRNYPLQGSSTNIPKLSSPLVLR